MKTSIYKFYSKKFTNFMISMRKTISTTITMKSHWERQFFIIFRTIGLILIYYTFSIGITFYQKWFIKVCFVFVLLTDFLNIIFSNCSCFLLFFLSQTAFSLSINNCCLSFDYKICIGIIISLVISTNNRYNPNNITLER